MLIDSLAKFSPSVGRLDGRGDGCCEVDETPICAVPDCI